MLTTQFFWGMMLVFIYMALYANGGIASMSLTQVITYTWLHQAFYAFLNVRLNDKEISDSIKSGNVAYEIIRPYNLYYWWYIKSISKRIASGMLRFMPVALLPMFIQKSTYYLPFRLIGDLPFRIYSNNVGMSEGLISIGLQIIWIFILVILGNYIVKKSLNKVFIQGG